MSIEVTTSQWRLVEVGRIVLLDEGKYAGKLATIVEIIDHKRVLLDAPVESGFPRQSFPLSNLHLTSIVIPNLPRGCRKGVVAKLWAKEDVNSKWEQTAWAKKIGARKTRRGLSDFQRFQVMVLKKQRRFAVKKQVAKAKKAAA